jgi:2'-5' RNA ligase
MSEIGKQGNEDLNTARVFFALWPNEAVRGEFLRWAEEFRKDCGGRVTQPANIHLTLVFLGNIPASRLEELTSLAAGISGRAFHLEFSEPNYFRHNRIVWAAPTKVPEELSGLVNTLETAIRAGGFSFDARTYVPHATLLRSAHRSPDAGRVQNINWHVKDFVLVRSKKGMAGVGYNVIARWALT